MKKRWICSILSLIAAICMLFAFAACEKDITPDEGDNPPITNPSGGEGEKPGEGEGEKPGEGEGEKPGEGEGEKPGEGEGEKPGEGEGEKPGEGEGEKPSEGEGEKPKEHEDHSLAWRWDDNEHYQVCTVEGCEYRTEPQAHEFGEWTTVQAATCVTEGLRKHSCTVCSKEVEETTAIDPSNHTLASNYVFVENGHYRKCLAEGCNYQTPTEEHVYEEGGGWIIVTPASCEEKGLQKRQCTVCAYLDMQQISAIGHDSDTEWHTDGSNHWHLCQREGCENPVTNVNSHEFGEWTTVQAATCVTEGLRKHSCTVCGEEVEETTAIDPSNHTLASNYVFVENGHYRKCLAEGCNYQTPTEEHVYGEDGGWIIITPSTCEEKGLQKRQCVACFYLDMQQTSALGHDPDTEWHTDGTNHWHLCQREDCENPVTDYNLHTYGAWEVEKAATCTENGFKTRACTVCERSESEQIASLGHEYSAWVTTLPTCMEEGKRERICSECGNIETRILLRLDHEMSRRPGKEPTCTEQGWVEYEICLYDCGTSTYRELPALGHQMVKREGIDPTCTETGCKPWEDCTREGCGYSTKESNIIPALGHDFREEAFGEFCARCGEENYVPSEGLAFNLDGKNNWWEVVGCGDCEDEAVVIPETYQGRVVKVIAAKAFANNKLVKSVRSRTVTKIGEEAFAYSTIESIKFDKLAEIEAQAFSNCRDLTEFTMPATVTRFGLSIFYGCTNLKELKVDEQSPYFYAESNCIISKSLNSVVLGIASSVIPDYVTRISSNAFMFTEIEEVVIPDSVKVIETWAFMGCYKLTTVTVGSDASIAEQAFMYCWDLTKVVIKASSNDSSDEDEYRGIGKNAFLGCGNLKEIEFKGTKDMFRKLVECVESGIMGNVMDGNTDTGRPVSVIVHCLDGDLVQGDVANEFIDV